MKARELKIKLFADGASLENILELNKDPLISGFTTNPTLMKKAGITDYEEFALKVLNHINDKPISFEVFADDFQEMKKQAEIINNWGDNVYVKIPVMNTKGNTSYELIQELTKKQIKLNITAIFTEEQVDNVLDALKGSPGAVVSIFAGRIADTGVDPVPMMKKYSKVIDSLENIELLWASPRELLNIVQANDSGCHIITATPDILKKLSLLEKDLTLFSKETVEMFYEDATSAGYKI